MESFVRKFGFERSEVTLDNWKDYPFNTWSLQHVSELIPTASVEGAATAVIARRHDPELFNQYFVSTVGRERIRDFFERSYTDAFVVMSHGKIIGEYFANGMDAQTPHLIFSVSKSVAGLLAGAVVKQFGLNTAYRVIDYLPEAQGSAYADCTVRDLLDMRVSVAFEETYESKQGLYARYRRSMLWMPAGPDENFLREDLASYVLSLPKGPSEHGKSFSYRSPNSDVLGLVLERISGIRYPDLLSRLLWKPLGATSATITVDNLGASRVAGGISCTVEDLALLGALVSHRGLSGDLPVIDAKWIDDIISGGDKQAWRDGDFSGLFPSGSYRNQWYSLGNGAVCAIGIHGQWLYVDPKQDLVIVRMSSQPAPDDDELDSSMVAIFGTITSHVAS